MPDIQTVEMSVQVPTPQVVVSVDGADLHTPGVVFVNIEKEYTASSQMTIIQLHGTKQYDLSSYVPDGYSFAGFRNAYLENYSGGDPRAQIRNSTTVLFMNFSTSASVKSGSMRIIDGVTTYYYKLKAVMVCIKN